MQLGNIYVFHAYTFRDLHILQTNVISIAVGTSYEHKADTYSSIRFQLHTILSST